MTALRELAPHVKWLRKAAEEIRSEGNAGWGNTCEEAADAVQSALDAEGDSRAVPFGWWVKYANGYEDFIHRLPVDPDVEDVPTQAMPLYTHPQPARSGVVSDEQVDLVAKAICRAWSLGQTYWLEADSKSWKQQEKSFDTQRKFDMLFEKTLAAIKSQGEKP